MKTDYVGIDYSLGQSNFNTKTGIHFGVIPHMEVGEAWYDIEPTYDCEGCEFEQCNTGDCEGCELKNTEDCTEDQNCDPCENYYFVFDDDGYKAQQSGEVDIFVIESPYYTLCQFCSPCAPGAGYLMNTVIPDGVKAYCLGHHWFEGEKAPYPVFDVKTDKEIKA